MISFFTDFFIYIKLKRIWDEDGQATINLQLDLGLLHGSPQEHHHQKQVSPSRLRRRARRAQARAEAAVDGVHVQATAA